MGVPQQKMTLPSFLDWENAQPERHEFHQGEVVAMVGGRRSHGRVVLNLAAALHGQLSGSPCQVFAESMKLQVGENTLLYPDVFVTCDQADLATEMIFRAPTLVAEVLSPSTQAYDRGAKFALYRRVPALREYLLVDPEARTVEAFRRTADSGWTFHDLSDSETVALASLDCTVPVADLFRGVDPAG